MRKQFLIGCLAVLAMSAQAAPITFSSVQYSAQAVAVTNGEPGLDLQSSPPGGLPVIASAFSVGLASDLATAGAIAGASVLSASADVWANGFGTSAGVASMLATFANTDSRIVLSIDSMLTNLVSGTGNAAASLFVLLISDGTTLFSDYVTDSWQYIYAPTMDTVSMLQLTLSTEANSGLMDSGFGEAAAAGSVTFDVQAVPEPATALLLLASLGLMAGLRNSRRAGGHR